MKTLKRIFLLRRRIDLWVLFVAAMVMPLRLPAGPLILFIYSCIGVYLAFSMHRFHRFYGAGFYMLITAYMVWCLSLMGWRGELSLANRQVGYVLLIWLYAFAGLGMALIRDPLRIFALGSRFGIIICAFVVAGEALFWGGRIGIGGNPAVFAYAAAIASVAATLPVRNAPRLLPSGPLYLILGTGIVFSSETRAVMLTLALVAIVETIVMICRITNHKVKLGASLILALSLATVCTVGPAASVLSDRFSGMMHYYETGDSSLWSDKTSADTREQMWRGAGIVIAQHPLIGVGAEQKMPAVKAALGDQATLLSGYIHVHNSILDELLVSGVIGLVLLLASACYGLLFLWRNNHNTTIRRVLIYFMIIWGSYAMLHNPLLHESSIAVTMLFFSVLFAATSRNILRSRSDAGNALCNYNPRQQTD